MVHFSEGPKVSTPWPADLPCKETERQTTWTEIWRKRASEVVFNMIICTEPQKEAGGEGMDFLRIIIPAFMSPGEFQQPLGQLSSCLNTRNMQHSIYTGDH